MADTTALKNRIRAAIKANDNQEITGPVLQQALLDIVDELNGATETEASARQNGDSTLQQGINTERQQRQEADNTLQQNITAEAAARQQKDNQLDEKVDDIERILGFKDLLSWSGNNYTFAKLDFLKSGNIVKVSGESFPVGLQVYAYYYEDGESKYKLLGTLTNSNKSITSTLDRDLYMIYFYSGSSADFAVDITIGNGSTVCEVLDDNTEAINQLDSLITGIKNNIDNGYVYAGIATPSTTPVSGKVFYIAIQAGTYTDFDELVVVQGINILKYNGTAWTQEQLIGIDDEPTAGSNNLVKSGGVQNELVELGLKIGYKESLSWSGVVYRFNRPDLLKSGNIVKVSGESFPVGLQVYAYYYEDGESKYKLLGTLTDSNKSITSTLDRDLYMIYFYSNSSADFSVNITIGNQDNIMQILSINSSAITHINERVDDLERILGYRDLLSWSGISYDFKKSDLLKSGNIVKVSGESFPASLQAYAYYYEDGESKYILLGTLTNSNKSITSTLDRDLYMIYFYSGSGGDFAVNISIGDGGTVCEAINDNTEAINQLDKRVDEIEGFKDLLSWSGIAYEFRKPDLLKSGNTFKVSGESFPVGLQVYAYYYEDGESKSKMLGTLTDSNKSITSTLDRDLYMIYFYSGSSANFSVNITIYTQDSIPSDIDECREISFPRFSACRIIKRAGCIGDSFTQGDIQVPTEPPTYDIVEEYAWPHYMEILTGHIYENWGQSGSTAKKWVNGEAKLSIVQQPGNKCQVYIIGLMINDRGGALGTISDINTDADSYYAWYYKLIQEVVNVNPEAIIICNTCPLYQTNDEWNNAVRDIVNYCRTQNQHVLCCDIASEKYKGELYYGNPLWSKLAYTGHPNLIGHEYAAECYYAALNDLILSNYSEFQSLHLIDYDAVNR